MTLEDHRRRPAKIGISELRAGPARVFERVLDQLADGVLTIKGVSRLGTLKQARPISLDEL